MSLAVYDALGRFYNWQQLPKSDSDSPFFGFSGCNRSNLESVLIGLRSDYGDWINADAAARTSTFSRVAWDYNASTGADYSGIIKFCNWVLVAANGDSDVRDWLRGGSFDTFDYIAKVVSETASSAASSAADTIKYGVEYQGEAEKTLLNRVLPVAGLVAACILVKKVLD